MRNGRKKAIKNKTINSASKTEKERHREFETPSQRRNRDGLRRGQTGSDGGPVRGEDSKH